MPSCEAAPRRRVWCGNRLSTEHSSVVLSPAVELLKCPQFHTDQDADFPTVPESNIVIIFAMREIFVEPIAINNHDHFRLFANTEPFGGSCV